jgi:predicted Holliday junction resolvase-like endonuclease
MSDSIGVMFGEFAYILAICPNPDCGQIFRLNDARPFLRDKQPNSILDEIDRESARIDNALERLEAQEEALRAQAKAAGLKEAKRRLKRIDPVFSGTRLDPQDVKVIFDPVEYVVFDGMNNDKLRRILLLTHPPTTTAAERILRSISDAVQKGHTSFKTLRVLETGGLELN